MTEDMVLVGGYITREQADMVEAIKRYRGILKNSDLVRQLITEEAHRIPQDPPVKEARAIEFQPDAPTAAKPDLLAIVQRFVDGINHEWHPLFNSPGPLSDDERRLLEDAEAALQEARNG